MYSYVKNVYVQVFMLLPQRLLWARLLQCINMGHQWATYHKIWSKVYMLIDFTVYYTRCSSHELYYMLSESSLFITVTQLLNSV
jgi:hypothetical protein